MQAGQNRRGVLVASWVVVAAIVCAPLTPATAVPVTAVPTTDAVSRERAVAEPLVPMIEVDVSDFVDDAAELPPELETALRRDVGISGSEWLAQAEASEVGIEVVDALRDHIDVRGARLEGLELVVTVGSAADATVVERVGAIAELGRTADRVGEPIAGLLPAADLRGGTPYTFNTVGGGFRCSVGFVGRDTVTAQAQIMSAGHCEGDGLLRVAKTSTAPTVSGGGLGNPSQIIGDAGLHVTDLYANPGFTDPTYYDYGLTPVTGTPWTPLPEVVTWGGSTSGGPLDSAPLVIRDAGPALDGATLCKSGATTGWTCGVILDVDQVNAVGTASCPGAGDAYCVGSIEASICVRSGDSGGSAVVGSRAVGITSASSVISGSCTSGGLGVFATLYSANPAYEQVTKVYPTWEPLVGFAPPTVGVGGVSRFDNTLSGSINGGSVRHDISLALDLGGTFTDEVDASGVWSANIGAVPTGTRSFTLQSSWGSGAQQSAPATGRFLKAAASRLSASDRYGTSVAISQFQFPGTPVASSPLVPGVPVVYLANGASFPDALSAGPAAAYEGGPLLLTPASGLTAATAAELDRLNPQSIVIVGGPAVVSTTVESQAAAYTSTPITRLGGANRYETSRLIAQRMLDQGLATGSDLWVATGTNFPDALSAGAAAAGQGIPILLVSGTASSIDAETATFVSNQLQSDGVYIAGGTGVVSEGIRTSLLALASTSAVTRAGGADRFATSLAINEVAYPASAPRVFLAYGYNFPDALSGSVVAGLRGAPLYITQTGCVSSAIVDHILDLNPSQVTVFGGSTIVSDSARDLVRCS